jgi:hypothetical protein
MACPIGADEGEYLAIVGPKCHVIDGREAAEMLPDPL